jgi:PAS domain S-box-containing protein
LLLVGGTDEVTAERLAALDDAFDASAASLSAATDRLAGDDGVDCVVVADVDDLPAALERLASADPSVPRVVVDDGGLDAGAAVDAGATDVVPMDAPRVSAQRVRNVVGVPPGRAGSDGAENAAAGTDTTTRIRRLHEVAGELDKAETETEIYELVVAAAADILAFDICFVSIVEDGEIRPQAATDAPLLEDPAIMTVDEGVAGRTVRTGETCVVDDAADDPDTAPVDDAYRSALSIPVGDWGVFQAISTETAAFSTTDRELGELLVSHLESAVERVVYEETLRHERDRFAALFENVPDAVVRTHFEDNEPIVDDVNPAFERIFGYDAEIVAGENLDTLIVPQDQRDDADDINESVRAGDDLDDEVVRMTTDGPRSFLLRNAPFTLGEDHRGWAIYTDIEDLKRREREFQRQNERLEEFAGMVSHDLRSPLNVAAGNIEAATEGLPGDNLQTALEALDRMDRLIEDLLTLARKGRVVSEPEPTDVDTVARSAWWGVETHGADLSVGALPEVAADPDRLRELFENLFRNAIVHGGDDVSISVGPLRAGGGFYVADDGPGIPAADREHLFDPGFTTHEEGTGLGLAIVDEIAAAHGWSVRATESADGGARFEVRFDADVGGGQTA